MGHFDAVVGTGHARNTLAAIRCILEAVKANLQHATRNLLSGRLPHHADS
jgi:hypothetical protein